jgi:hypothetical protein
MKLKILLLCNKPRDQASTVCEHIDAIVEYSKYQIDTFDPRYSVIDKKFLSKYDVIIIHYSIVIILDAYLPTKSRFYIANFSGPKILFIQDEYRFVNHTVSCIKALGINTVFTCVPEHEIPQVYCQKRLESTRFINTLTGYVNTKFLDNQLLPSYEERENDVIYRGRKLSACYGRLAREKFEIVNKFYTATSEADLILDLSYKEEDRIYGEKWLNFIKSSKATLGTESGASVFDFTGEINKLVHRYEMQFPEASFEEIEEKFFPGLDGLIKVNQLSPRIFEAACFKTLMILYEGEYSGALIPWRHYLPLKKDFSNIQEVLNVLSNREKWQEIVDNAYDEIAKNPKYSYQNFVENVDEVIAGYNIQRDAIRNKWERLCIIFEHGLIAFKRTRYLFIKGLKLFAVLFALKVRSICTKIMSSLNRLLFSLIRYYRKKKLIKNFKKYFCFYYTIDNQVIACASLPTCDSKALVREKEISRKLRKLLETKIPHKVIICDNCKWVQQGYNPI